MNPVLLVAAASLAAVFVPSAPASAQAFTSGAQSANGPAAMQGSFAGRHTFDEAFHGARRHAGFSCDGRDGRHHGGRDHRRDFGGCDFAGLGWGYYDQDINRSWDSDSFNDWWHDRPDRAYPRWVSHNEDCTPDRMWWSGSGWHC